MSKCVAAIVPAYNEQETIADVVCALVASPHVDEVIVVSDGSTDGTVAEASAAGATVYELEQQKGKGQALLFGVGKTDASIIAFFDADLLGLSAEHIEQLVLPVTTGSRLMNVGLRDKGPVGTYIAKHFPLIGGERVMVREVFEGVGSRYTQGYMVETALNYYCRSRGYSYGAVILRGLTMRRKHEKVGPWRAMLQYAKMWAQVAQGMTRVRLARMRNEF